MALDNDFNLDPITLEPGAHPLGTGVGAAAGGAAGAAVGLVGGPAGALVGAAVGAVAGGLGGKATAETVNPTAEAAYWESNYRTEPYYQTGRSFDDYAPAYSLGLFGYTEYGGIYDDTESRLAMHWNDKKQASTLSWPEASAASRAAWERVDRQSQAGLRASDDTIDTLNDLLSSCHDGQYGFRECASHTRAQDIKTLLVQRADDCRAAAVDLQILIRDLGGQADEGGSVNGALHRGWVSVKGTLSGYTDYAILDECERAEDAALAHYRKALKHPLPTAVKTLVDRQAQGVQRNHDQIKALRDALKPAR